MALRIKLVPNSSISPLAFACVAPTLRRETSPLRAHVAIGVK